MAQIIIPRVWRAQPGTLLQPDWNNKLSSGLTHLYNSDVPYNLVNGGALVVTNPASSTADYARNRPRPQMT